MTADRDRLTKKRPNETFTIGIGNHTIELSVGMYPNGSPAEAFIDVHKVGAPFRAMCHIFAVTLSIGLQHGVPIETYVNAIREIAGDPNGSVTGLDVGDDLKTANSIPDLVCRLLAYLARPAKDGDTSAPDGPAPGQNRP